MNLKKKILGFVLAFCMLVPGLFLLTACGENKIDVDSVTLNETAKTMVVDDTFKLVATVKPDDATEKTVSWSSSAESIVTVGNDGLVTAVGVGVADVTVKSVDDETKFAVCHITVTEKPTLVTGISLNETEIEIEKNDTYTLVATITPSDATNKDIVWESSRPAYVSVDENGRLTANMPTGAESAIITATTKDGQYSAKCKVSVYVPVTELNFNITEKTIFATDNGFNVKYSYNQDATKLSFGRFVADDSKDLIKLSYVSNNTIKVQPLGKVGIAKFYVEYLGVENSNIKAECTVNLIAPYATIGNNSEATQYTKLQDAINASTGEDSIYIYGYMAVDSTVSINKSCNVSITSGRRDEMDGIFASKNFVGGNLIEVEGTGKVSIDGLTLNAQEKARVMYVGNSNAEGVSLNSICFKNGKRSNTWAPGLFITGKSVVSVNGCVFEGNKNNDNVLSSDPTKYYATDIWAGSQTKVTLQGDCRIGRMIKNANYAGDADSILVVALNSDYGGSIKELFVQYDEEYGTENSIANKGTGVAGAVVKFVCGTIENMYIANENNNVEHLSNPEVGYVYQAGKDKISIA